MKKPLVDILNKNKSDVDFILDSGAFTAWKAKKEIKLDDYCRFIESLPFVPDRYFMLDVIGNPSATMKNYELMLKRGFKPVPVFTRGEDVSILEEYFKTSDMVGIGGLVGTEGNKGFVKGIMEIAKNRKVHWLGFARINYVEKLRPYSVDCSTWANGLRFGQIQFYSFTSRRIMTLGKAQLSNPKIKDMLYREKDYYGVTLKEIFNLDDWYHSGKNLTITERLSYKSSVAISMIVKKHYGTNYSIAVASENQADGFIQAYKYWKNKL